MLASGKTSRLYRTLVYEQRMATEIAASQNSREIGGYFQIVATAAPGRTLAELERGDLAGARRRSPTRARQQLEMERCQAQAEANFIYRLQTVGGFGGKGDQLNAYNVYPRRSRVLRDAISARYRNVTPEAMQRASRDVAAAGAARHAERRAGAARPARALEGSQPVAVA